MIGKIIKTTYRSGMIRYWNEGKNIISIDPSQRLYFSPLLSDELKTFLLIIGEHVTETESMQFDSTLDEYRSILSGLKIEEVDNISGWIF